MTIIISKQLAFLSIYWHSWPIFFYQKSIFCPLSPIIIVWTHPISMQTESRDKLFISCAGKPLLQLSCRTCMNHAQHTNRLVAYFSFLVVSFTISLNNNCFIEYTWAVFFMIYKTFKGLYVVFTVNNAMAWLY